MTDHPMHFSIALNPDEADWYPANCNCGWQGGIYPTAEDACDALMQHAYERGILDQKKEQIA